LRAQILRLLLELPEIGGCSAYGNLNGFEGFSHAALFIRRVAVNNIIYIVGLVVVILAVLAFFGLR
jgi:hypothetical protein